MKSTPIRRREPVDIQLHHPVLNRPAKIVFDCTAEVVAVGYFRRSCCSLVTTDETAWTMAVVLENPSEVSSKPARCPAVMVRKGVVKWFRLCCHHFW